jgi:hypothetical protein
MFIFELDFMILVAGFLIIGCGLMIPATRETFKGDSNE